jgi:hypothetical protein
MTLPIGLAMKLGRFIVRNHLSLMALRVLPLEPQKLREMALLRR